MVFKHMFFDLDFRNTAVAAQTVVIDTFFQNHTIEFWEVEDNEVMFGSYDENNTAGATRFIMFDAGVDGVKTNLASLNSNGTIATFIENNMVIKERTVNDRIVLVQYVARV